MKRLSVLLLSCMFLFASIQTAEGAIITVNKDGEVIWNVLSMQDELLSDREVEDFSVRQVAQMNNAGNDLINIRSDEGKIKLSVGSGDSVKEIEVNSEEDTLIEIEERPSTQKLTIGKSNGKFTINQGFTSVTTELPIKVNPMTARLSLETSSGESFLYILPRDAVRSVLRSKVATQVKNNETIELTESEDKLVYKIPGEKLIPILSFYNYTFDVQSYISAQTGELVSVDAPTWYKIFGFLITQEM